MNTKILTFETVIEDEIVENYKLDRGNGTIIINLNKLLDSGVSDCRWIDDKNKYLQLMYSEWDNTEHFAILKANGDIIKKGIKEIHNYIPNVNLFVVMFSGFGLGVNDATNCNVADDEWKMAVIDKYGRFVLEPIYNRIQYFDDEDVLYADDKIYSFGGKFLRDDE